jgi:hypothetical protein
MHFEGLARKAQAQGERCCSVLSLTYWLLKSGCRVLLVCPFVGVISTSKCVDSAVAHRLGFQIPTNAMDSRELGAIGTPLQRLSSFA